MRDVHLLYLRVSHAKISQSAVHLVLLQVGSTIIAQAAGVPTLPWSGSGVAVDYGDCHGVIPVSLVMPHCFLSLPLTHLPASGSWRRCGSAAHAVLDQDLVRGTASQEGMNTGA